MRILLSMLVLLATASCVSAPPAPAPTRRIVEPPVAALPAPIPLASDWRDWPQTPGDWGYASRSGGTAAIFGQPRAPTFGLSCSLGTHLVTLTMRASSAASVTLRTTAQSRMLPLTDTGDTTLSANDPLLDAIAFSRGRFVVEQAGAPPLVLPAWAEVERVIEDCRR